MWFRKLLALGAIVPLVSCVPNTRPSERYFTKS
jgi:hypothetical protein